MCWGGRRPHERYHRLADDIRRTFTEQFVTSRDTADGLSVRVAGDTQTGYLVALAFDLLPAGLAEAAARRLGELVESAGPALLTGFLGVALAAPVLDDHGRADLAHALLHRDEVPSWRFPLRHGATTIWERWDGWTPGTGFRAPSMNSFNHYALGSIGEWLYRGVAGLDQAPDSTGYRKLRIRPRPGGLRHASAHHESVRGTVRVTWERRGDRIALRVQVPPGATADVYVPTADPGSVRESGLVPSADDRHITVIATASDHVVHRVSSGSYRFTAAHPPVDRPAGPPGAQPPLSLTPSRRTSGPATKRSFARSYEEDTP